ncbi:hypothetical protein BCR33DRAFT_779895 [Rhizoclosmatium globosum]|uniref:Uncharacterized protein n=1 Tax=Rhizoclosmatium globosum TaxID=329046 RepID=A0A1Y2D040_9FUNG|nr:hypothetical protein BCR33DRAFT_779895 [Rhizoclosmatium globosum]|eukprot:ORY52638.1 hypothetical protein BCR33DRAFT_779895 [Rhizoclosmatium globosum]
MTSLVYSAYFTDAKCAGNAVYISYDEIVSSSAACGAVASACLPSNADANWFVKSGCTGSTLQDYTTIGDTFLGPTPQVQYSRSVVPEAKCDWLFPYNGFKIRINECVPIAITQNATGAIPSSKFLAASIDNILPDARIYLSIGNSDKCNIGNIANGKIMIGREISVYDNCTVTNVINDYIWYQDETCSNSSSPLVSLGRVEKGNCVDTLCTNDFKRTCISNPDTVSKFLKEVNSTKYPFVAKGIEFVTVQTNMWDLDVRNHSVVALFTNTCTKTPNGGSLMAYAKGYITAGVYSPAASVDTFAIPDCSGNRISNTNSVFDDANQVFNFEKNIAVPDSGVKLSTWWIWALVGFGVASIGAVGLFCWRRARKTNNVA